MHREANGFFYTEKTLIGMIILQEKRAVDMKVVEFRKENSWKLALISGSMMSRRIMRHFVGGETK